MQNPNRLYDKNLRKYLYPPRNEYEKEKEYHKSPKKLSDLSNEYIKKSQIYNYIIIMMMNIYPHQIQVIS